MSYPTEPLKELDSTYFVQDRGNLEEVARLETQDTMLTAGMGGVLPELADPAVLRRVLDVGCGTGGWLIETARTYPTIEKLAGADISYKIMEQARIQAETQDLAGRVEFKTMDALRMLEFPNAFFDLVNQRLGSSWLRTWEWTKILSEYQRVARPGATIRVTESQIVESNSAALTKLCAVGLETCYRSGRFFVRRGDGITCQLAHLMVQHDIQDVQTQEHTLVFQAGTSEHQRFYEDMMHLFRVSLPFFQKWVHVPSNYEEIYRQALKEMQEPSFVATWRLLTVWGVRSRNSRFLYMRGLR